MGVKTEIYVEDPKSSNTTSKSLKSERYLWSKISLILLLIVATFLIAGIYYELVLDYGEPPELLYEDAGSDYIYEDKDNGVLGSPTDDGPERIQLPLDFFLDQSIEDHAQRVKRDTSMDPLVVEQYLETSYNELRTKIRDKRAQIKLDKLEEDYKRCRKAVTDAKEEKDCMKPFYTMFQIAKDISEKMDTLQNLFKDSEVYMLQNKTVAGNSSLDQAVLGAAMPQLDATEKTVWQGVASPENVKVVYGGKCVEKEQGKCFGGGTLVGIVADDLISNATHNEQTHTTVRTLPTPNDGTQTNFEQSSSKKIMQMDALPSQTTMNTAISSETSSDHISDTTKLHISSTVIEEDLETTTIPSQSDVTSKKSETNDMEMTSEKTTEESKENEVTLITSEEVSTEPAINKQESDATHVVTTSTTATSDQFDDSPSTSGTLTPDLTTLVTELPTEQTTLSSSSTAHHIIAPSIDKINFSTTTKASPESTTSFTTTKSPNKPDEDSHSKESSESGSKQVTSKSSSENMISNENSGEVSKALDRSFAESTKSENLRKLEEWKKKLEKTSARHNSELSELFEEMEQLEQAAKVTKHSSEHLGFVGASGPFLSLCERLAQHSGNKVKQQHSEHASNVFTPAPNMEFTSRGPGFPVTGETIKASAQFLYNPSLSTPQIPVCFFVNPGNFRMMNSPAWYPNMMGGTGFNTMGGNGMFFLPQGLGTMPQNQFQIGSSSGAQSAFGNAFAKGFVGQRSPNQQFYCTYMPGSAGVGPQNMFANQNSKMRQSPGNHSDTDIIYASYVSAEKDSKARQQLVDSATCTVSGFVPCYGSNECIAKSKWCDSTVDCEDGSDETACSCRDRLLADRQCDGYADCPVGEDEIGCFGCGKFMFSCYHSVEEYERSNRSTISMCFSSIEKCDGISNCLNGRDEEDCNLIVNDLVGHESLFVSFTEGYLYRNYKGNWYPVCNNGHTWAKEACESEMGRIDESPLLSFEAVSAQGLGPFIEPSRSNHGGLIFPTACQRRENNLLKDLLVRVKCPEMKCGLVTDPTINLSRHKGHRRSRKSVRPLSRKKRIDEDERVVGGSHSKPLQWPFIIALYRNGVFHCGGAIYNQFWIITAAHCVISHEKYYYEIQAGVLRRSSYSASVQIRKGINVVMHAEYDRHTMKNDLALIEVDIPFKFNRWVKPICLPARNRTGLENNWVYGPRQGTLCITAGWGAIREKGPSSDPLREVEIPIVSKCTEEEDVEARDICAGDVSGGRDACQGDSGGPLFCRSVSNLNEWYLAAVVSHGNGCGRAGEFGVYTRVALYLDWIAKAVRGNNLGITVLSCPGFTCIFGGRRCLPAAKRCDRSVDCLGGEDEIGCSYDFVPDVGIPLNATTEEPTNSDDIGRGGLKFTLDLGSDFSTENSTQETSTTADSTTKREENITTTRSFESNKSTKAPSTTLLITNTTESPSIANVNTTITAGVEEISSSTENPSGPSKIPQNVPTKFSCKRIHQLIDMSRRCDRITDCEDGSDEMNCACREFLKGSLNILICDGKSDCEDGSDEDNCGNCTTSEFLCPLSKQCIPLSKRCNNFVDCTFKEDESDCFALTNGKQVKLDRHKRPALLTAGIFSKNTNGSWKVVCSHETNFDEHEAKTAHDICSLLGFNGVSFHNTTTLSTLNIMHIDPEISRMMQAANNNFHTGDSFHFQERNKFESDVFLSRKIPRTLSMVSTPDHCKSLFVGCKAQYNSSKPIPILHAGDELKKEDTTQTLRPLIRPNGRPSVVLKPTTEQVQAKNTSAGADKAQAVLVFDKIHRGHEQTHYPWLVDVYVNGKLNCVGILLDKFWIAVHPLCADEVNLEQDYVVAYVGGSNGLHHVNSHQRFAYRMDCVQTVENSDVLLFHVEFPVHFTRYVLPTFLPEEKTDQSANGTQECMSIIHDKFGGIKTFPVVISNASLCQDNESTCYQQLELKGSHDVEDSCDSDTLKEGKRNHGMIVCREEDSGWYPQSFFVYNVTQCDFRNPFGVRTLERNYTSVQNFINNRQCQRITYPGPECSTMRCPLGNCLQQDEICNGKQDCHDGSDEEVEFCQIHRKVCDPGHFKCRNGQCVAKSKFCDQVDDCGDLSDEPTSCSCLTYLQATDPGKICDGIRNCWDKRDESPAICDCTPDRFPCGGGSNECIPRDFVCDKEPDCPRGEDELFCYGIEQPMMPGYPSPGYGQVIEQAYGVWHTKCFPKSTPPDLAEVEDICRKLGYKLLRRPTYRLIDDFIVNKSGRAAGDDSANQSSGKYRDATKAVVVNKFSPVRLNPNLTFYIKPSRPIAELVKWNATDSDKCYRLEIKCE